MIVQDYPFFCDMPEDMRYLRQETFSRPFIEKSIIFIIPDKIRDFRKNLYHVRRRENEEGAVYVPLFRGRCQLAHEPVTEGYSGPCDVYPFYTQVARNRRHYLDYYMLFLFRGQAEFAKFRDLTA